MRARRSWQEDSVKVIEYPESFRLKVVKEVESGLYSKDEIRRKYGIGGKTTILYWCRKYGRKDYPYMPESKRKSVKTMDDKDNRIAELEAKLARQELAIDALEALIDVANEMYGTDLKKKVGTKRSKSSKK